MRILLTNDDGIGAAGLAALEAAFGSQHELWVVAPDGERSGTSHAIHMHGPVRVHQEGERRFSCSGTPADCVFLGLKGDFLPGVDAVLSGINHGPNLGTDIVYSGTCAAARQGAFAGVPAVAVSLASFQAPLDFDTGARWLAERWDQALAVWRPGHFVNVNLPAKPVFPLVGQPAEPCVRRYFDKVITFTDPRGDQHCFVEGLIRDDEVAEGSDWGVVRRGRVALSLIVAQPSATTWPGGSW